ncbi:diacylglycerol kinase [Marinobacter subterrani]|uniref:Diacylglycerol kinase n=1 Tax=Marinobacter subterrani TaxID=1658765 RepID=A0A0J7M5S4_9GAMM|nr:diacylglycerol kinase [Marinobacter subterrani]KMQ76310.1 Diacylglycerol kinase [Marinobacter subterrani]
MSDLLNSGNASSLKGQKGVLRILRATSYSMMGFKAAFLKEAAFRQLVLINVILQPIALSLDITRAERAILMVVPLLSLAIELLNTAIENTVDRVSLDLHPLSKDAKDMGSAAQFVGLVMIVVAWLVILV